MGVVLLRMIELFSSQLRSLSGESSRSGRVLICVDILLDCLTESYLQGCDYERSKVFCDSIYGM